MKAWQLNMAKCTWDFPSSDVICNSIYLFELDPYSGNNRPVVVLRFSTRELISCYRTRKLLIMKSRHEESLKPLSTLQIDNCKIPFKRCRLKVIWRMIAGFHRNYPNRPPRININVTSSDSSPIINTHVQTSHTSSSEAVLGACHCSPDAL